MDKREIAQRCQTEGEGDRDAGEHGASHDADEEDQQIELAEIGQDRLQFRQAGDRDGDGGQREQCRRRADERAMRSSSSDAHQRDAERHGAARQPMEMSSDMMLTIASFCM